MSLAYGFEPLLVSFSPQISLCSCLYKKKLKQNDSVLIMPQHLKYVGHVGGIRDPTWEKVGEGLMSQDWKERHWVMTEQ